MKTTITKLVCVSMVLTFAHPSKSSEVNGECAVSQFPDGGRVEASCSVTLWQEYNTPCGGNCSKQVADSGQSTSQCQVCVSSSFSWNDCGASPANPEITVTTTKYSGDCGNLTGSGYDVFGHPNGGCNPCQNMSVSGVPATQTCYNVDSGSSSCLTDGGTWNH